jgi:hypothetical protein
MSAFAGRRHWTNGRERQVLRVGRCRATARNTDAVVDTTQGLIALVSLFVLALAIYAVAAAAVLAAVRYLRRPRAMRSPVGAARRGRTI